MKLFAIGVGEAVKKYEQHLSKIFNEYKTITIHNGLLKLQEQYGLYPTYFTWGDPFGALHSLRHLVSLTEIPDTTILVPSTMTTTYETFRKYHGTSRITPYWGEYITLIGRLVEKGYKVYEVPCNTPKAQPISDDKRFNNEVIIGSVPYVSDASEARNAKETKLTSLVFPLAYYLGAKQVYTLGFDGIGGRFYDKIEGVPQDPWPSNDLPYLEDNLLIWKNWRTLHDMDLISVVEDKLTINNKILEHQTIESVING